MGLRGRWSGIRLLRGAGLVRTKRRDGLGWWLTGTGAVLWRFSRNACVSNSGSTCSLRRRSMDAHARIIDIGEGHGNQRRRTQFHDRISPEMERSPVP